MRSLALALVTLGGVAAPLPTQRPSVDAPPARHAVVAATPDLGALLAAIGGDRIDLTTLAKGPQDPHYLDPRPSMLYAIQRAELLVHTGRGLEDGWLPVLVDNGRNPNVSIGQLGNLDASRAVRALGVPGAGVDRSAGDLHMAGNPHYLLDPLCGLQVAAMLRDRCASLWPGERATFTANYDAFRQRLAVAMVGEGLAAPYDHDVEQLAQAFARGVLADVLRQQGDLDQLGGWFGALLPLRGARIVVDHDLWPYFAERFGLEVFGFLEPKPGVSPSTSHLEQLAARMRSAGVRAVLTTCYFPNRYARVLEQEVGAVVVPMAHQPGARAGTDDYVDFVGYNVRQVAGALAPRPKDGG